MKGKTILYVRCGGHRGPAVLGFLKFLRTTEGKILSAICGGKNTENLN